MKTQRGLQCLAIAAGLAFFGTSIYAQKLPDADFKKLAASAQTSADHKKLAAHYRAHALEHDADAKLHEEVVAQYRKARPFDDIAWDFARDSSHYVQHSREAAQVLRDLAAAHEARADELAKAKKK